MKMTPEELIIKQAEMIHDLSEASRYMMGVLERIRDNKTMPANARAAADQTLKHLPILMESSLS